jgi:hypothetical protein
VVLLLVVCFYFYFLAQTGLIALPVYNSI